MLYLALRQLKGDENKSAFIATVPLVQRGMLSILLRLA